MKIMKNKINLKNLILVSRPKLRFSKKQIMPTLLVFMLVAAWFFAWYFEAIYVPLQPNPIVKRFIIEKGQGLEEISSNLKEKDLIRSPLAFNIYATLTGKRDNLMAGGYDISPAMSVPEILKKIVAGDIVKARITVMAGWDIADIAQVLQDEEICSSRDIKTTSRKDFSEEFSFLKDKPDYLDLEGYLFPDTYEMKVGDTAEIILSKMLSNFKKQLTPAFLSDIQSSGKTLPEIVIMASLLEKEVVSYNDKQIVAGILWKRLRNDWPLQVDATIVYATGKNGNDILRSDYSHNSDYNTYTNKGLPPGPICNPGLESIKAAVYYQESPYWYYLTARTGETLFSATLDEHNTKRALYMR